MNNTPPDRPKPPRVWQRENWLSVLLVTLVTSLTYGPLLAQLGFYRDDWYLIWTAQTQGMEGVLSLFKGDRPLLGWLYVFDYKLLGSAPLNWHLYALLIKIFSALAFLWLLRSLWPAKKIETTFIALLFAVYPGFYQQPDAATFKNLLLAYGSAMLSLALTIQALKARSLTGKISLVILALGTAAFYAFIYEALIGIEAARLLFIWYYLQRQENKDWKALIRKTAAESISYWLFAAGFIYWRIFLFDSTRRATNVGAVLSDYSSLPLHSMARLVIETIKDLLETSLLAWGVPYYQFTVQADYRLTLLAVMLAFGGVTLSGMYWFLSQKQVSAESETGTSPYIERDWIILGAVITVVTTIPIVAAGRNVIFGTQWDRYTYQSLLGVALLIGGIVFYGVRGRLRWVLFSVLLMSGMITQLFSADYYRTFWTLERNAMWQLSWRAPQIEAGTTLVLAMPAGFRLAEEYEVWGPANLVYAPNGFRVEGQVLFDQIWADLVRGRKENRSVRGTVRVVRDYGKVIIISQPSLDACLHVLNGTRFDQAVTEPASVRLVAQFSDVGLIDVSAAPMRPPNNIFGMEPQHDWCYFYQKMDLARQQQDWPGAADLANQAISLGLKATDVSEWMPALESYVNLKDTQGAKKIARLIQKDKAVYINLCAQLRVVQPQFPDYDRELVLETLCQLK